MRKNYFMSIMVAVVMLLMFGGNAFAGNNLNLSVKNRNENTAIATGGNANQRQEQEQSQTQTQSSYSGGNTYEAARNHVTASTLQNFATAVTPSTPLGWKHLGCDFIVAEFSIGQLKKMAEGASFMKKRGTFWHAVFSEDVDYSIFGGKETAMDDSAVVRIMVKVPARISGNAYLGEAEGIGRYGAPMGQIIGATVLGLVQKTGTTQVVLYWDYLIEPLAMSNTLGIGFVGSASEKAGAGSVALGAASSTTYNLTSIAYRVKAQAFSGLGEDFFTCQAPKEPEPEKVSVVPPPVMQEKACDPSEIWKRIDDLRKEIGKCLSWCFNNFVLRSKLGEAYIDLYQCTGDKKYLASAINEFEIAERNYLRGKDIKNHRVEADRLMVQDYYFWSGCINVLYGADAADKFAAKHGIEKVPQL